MRIVIDAMGGDHAPDSVVMGAVHAVKDFNAELVLVGKGEEILAALSRCKLDTLPKGIEIANAEDAVDMHDDPATVVKTRKDSSMIVGLKMLAEGKGDAFISAGSTGALLTASTLIVKRIRGIRRAALAPILPTATGHCILIDCGANAECTPELLVQFACMGSQFAKSELKIERPRVGLLNNGAEDTKGLPLHKATYPLLQELSDKGIIHFVGNVEGRDVPLGGADVVVTDGFSGNILLKSVEGTAKFMSGQMKEMFNKNIFTKIAALLCKDGLGKIKKTMDYRLVGGTPLLGISKPVIKTHGSSDELAIYHAIRLAIATVDGDVVTTIKNSVALTSAAKES